MPHRELGDVDDKLLRELSLYAPDMLFFTGEERLRVSSIGNLAGAVLRVTGRFLSTTGEVLPFSHRFDGSTGLTETTNDVALGWGWLLSLNVDSSESATPLRRGQLFARIQLVRGSSATPPVVQTLLQGYLGNFDPLSWPGSAMEPAASGKGFLHQLSTTNPAAGAEISITVAANLRAHLRAMTFRFDTDATAVNREVALNFSNGGNLFARVPAAVNQAVSEIKVYSFMRGTTDAGFGTANVIRLPLPEFELQGGVEIVTRTANIQAGDQFSTIESLFEEWVEE